MARRTAATGLGGRRGRQRSSPRDEVEDLSDPEDDGLESFGEPSSESLDLLEEKSRHARRGSHRKHHALQEQKFIPPTINMQMNFAKESRSHTCVFSSRAAPPSFHSISPLKTISYRSHS